MRTAPSPSTGSPRWPWSSPTTRRDRDLQRADEVREVGAGARVAFGSYRLPVRKPVRAAEGLRAGDRVRVELTVSRDEAPRTGGSPSRRSAR
ncbi:DUF1905 domain-containing protein [Blastococcus sp. TF02A-35]|nr:DUF1905 domain-containing protein [Blastococcus sp. TF02A_35]